MKKETLNVHAMDVLNRRKITNKLAIVVGCLIITAFLGVTDFLTGPYLSFSIFYLIPVMLAAWFVGQTFGVSVAFICAAVWFTADEFNSLDYPHYLIPYWNAFVRLCFFLANAFLLSMVKRAFEKEKKISRMDALTGAMNSRAFYETAETEVERMRRRSAPLSVAYIDVDNFKGVNDTLGHSVGDKLLAMVVHTMKRELRGLDIVARLGGDEFAAMLPETDQSGAIKVVGRMKEKLDETMSENRWPVTFSVGLITFTKPPFSVNELIKEADGLMYEVKNNGKNSIKTNCL